MKTEPKSVHNNAQCMELSTGCKEAFAKTAWQDVCRMQVSAYFAVVLSWHDNCIVHGSSHMKVHGAGPSGILQLIDPTRCGWQLQMMWKPGACIARTIRPHQRCRM